MYLYKRLEYRDYGINSEPYFHTLRYKNKRRLVLQFELFVFGNGVENDTRVGFVDLRIDE